jgi:Ca2+-binding EF-hand superfamily protein
MEIVVEPSMRTKHSLLVIVAVLMIAPTFLHSQGGRDRWSGGGGFGGGMFGGGPPDPNMLFNMMSKGKDSINRADLDPRMQGMFDRFAESSGARNGIMTRTDFLAGMEKINATMKMSSNAMNGTGGGKMMIQGGPSSPMGGGTMPSFGGPMGSGGDRGSRMQFQTGGDPRAMMQQNAAQQMEDRRAEEFFNRSDKNRDGMISYEELSDRLRPLREKYDTNGDGFISLDEYKIYIKDQFAPRDDQNQNREPRPSSDGNNPDPRSPMINIAPPQEEAPVEIRRPTLFRAGKLPNDLPSWFTELDTDIDGQVGLYEWRKGEGRELYEFEGMDFNSDGLLTAEEVMKFLKLGDKEKSKLASKNGRSDRQGRNGGGMGSGGNNGGGGGGDWASRFGSGLDSGSSDKRSRDSGSKMGDSGGKGGPPQGFGGGFGGFGGGKGGDKGSGGPPQGFGGGFGGFGGGKGGDKGSREKR